MFWQFAICNFCFHSWSVGYSLNLYECLPISWYCTVVLWLYNYISISLLSSVWQKPGSWGREQDISVNCWLETRLESPKTNSWIAGPVNVKPLLGFFVHFSLPQKLPSMCLVFYQDEAQVVPILKWFITCLVGIGKNFTQQMWTLSEQKRSNQCWW